MEDLRGGKRENQRRLSVRRLGICLVAAGIAGSRRLTDLSDELWRERMQAVALLLVERLNA